MNAAIYARVSTDSQEREGTSLQTQLAACLLKASEHNLTVPDEYQFLEQWTGTELDRPKLAIIRDLIRQQAISAVVCYSTDRLSRDPVHLLLLAEECDKGNAPLLFVTEPLDNTMEGQLLSFVRGWASKLEALKIRERTVRGKRARALSGKLPAGSHARLYGYTYNRELGVREIDEDKAKWVKAAYDWVAGGMSTTAVTLKLRELGAPLPGGSVFWHKRTVQKMLRNPAYCGRTYCNTQTYTAGKPSIAKRRKSHMVLRPREDWIEIPGATPVIVEPSTWESAQHILEQNRRTASRNRKHEYLLAGHLFCGKCGRAYWGFNHIEKRGEKTYRYPSYRCSGRNRIVTPELCRNKTWTVAELDREVWGAIDAFLADPKQWERPRGSPASARELELVRKSLAKADIRRQRIHRAYEIAADERQFHLSLSNLDSEVAALKKRKAESLAEAAREVPYRSLEDAAKTVRKNLNTIDYAGKRLALSALGVRVVVDGDHVDVTYEPVECPPSGWQASNSLKAFVVRVEL